MTPASETQSTIHLVIDYRKETPAMCGIAGFYLRSPALQGHINLDGLLDELLLSIESRGKDATGFVAISDDGVAEWQKAAIEATTFCKWRRAVPLGTRTVLAHTRFATQGLPAFTENNHPIRRGPFFIIHNGHVTNDSELFRSAERGRFGQVDSEAIAARLASLKNLSALGAVMSEIEGDAAVAAVDERDATRLVVAKGPFSPLYVYDGRAIVMFASTREAIEKAHAKHIGHLSNSRLKSLLPGEQIEWTGDEKILSSFEVKRQKFFWSYVPSKGKKKELTQTSATTEYLWDDGDLDPDGKYPYACDNCSQGCTYANVFWRYDSEASFTYSLCEECSDLWDAGYFRDDKNIVGLIDDAEIEEFDKDDIPIARGFFDEYEEANNAILDDPSDDGILRRLGGLFQL